jgi:hypothetical protein
MDKEDIKYKKPGFKIGDYFVSFPADEIIKEDENGKLFILADIYKLDNNKIATRLKESEITPEVEALINDEIMRLLSGAIGLEDK